MECSSGPTASRKEIAAFRAKLEANPGNYIAQPTRMALSSRSRSSPKGPCAAAYVDLRPFVLMSPQGITITPAA